MVEQIVDTIQKLMCTKQGVIVAIDGRCGAGKTTLATALQQRFDCTLVHMDDFFLPPEKRTPERLSQPGENVDHERFLSQVLKPLKQGKDFAFCPFDCSKLDYGDPIVIHPGALTIVEGSYSCRPGLWEYYDLRIFVDVDPEEQMRRIVKRNPLSEQSFRTRWIPLKEAYFKAFDIRQKCDIIIKEAT